MPYILAVVFIVEAVCCAVFPLCAVVELEVWHIVDGTIPGLKTVGVLL